MNEHNPIYLKCQPCRGLGYTEQSRHRPYEPGDIGLEATYIRVKVECEHCQGNGYEIVPGSGEPSEKIH